METTSRREYHGEAGFTMVELIIVIIILGVLAATMLPKYMDVTGQANTAVTDKMHGDIRSMMSSAHGVNMVKIATGTAANALVPPLITTCAIATGTGYMDDNGGITCAGLVFTFPDGRVATMVAETATASATLGDLGAAGP